MEIKYSLDRIDRAAQELLSGIGRSGVVAFYGKMGAGKTTLIKALCAAMGANDWVNSPTFTLVNEYCATDGSPIYHFDFYRINKITEAYDMGCEEYFYTPSALCLIEWPELIEPLLPSDVIRVGIEELPNGERRLQTPYVPDGTGNLS